MDCLNAKQRRKAMRANKSKDTSIELILRRALWRRGIRYRKNVSSVLGSPDIAIPKYKMAIFCDGEFWHGKRDISKCNKYWLEKIKRNKERDLEITIQLRDEGWTVLRFWEKEIRENIDGCVEIVEVILKKEI